MEKNICAFWKHNIHPITGFIENKSSKSSKIDATLRRVSQNHTGYKNLQV